MEELVLFEDASSVTQLTTVLERIGLIQISGALRDVLTTAQHDRYLTPHPNITLACQICIS